MTELDKFKRRVIRSVARVIRQEGQDKMADPRMWEDLQKEVGCDCKMLWERMRTLTLKKMKRLLPAEDRLRAIAEVAQMQLTDWLLFDLVLVHEDIDVITENPNSKSMKDLVKLVQMFEIEGKSGEALTAAWTSATFYYNSFGRQCSPMLLQRRWYQLKKMTRERFYSFWFTYRGNSRLLEAAKKNMPNDLHSLVAKRYPYIVTKPLKEWNELIQEKFVILPEEFEAKMRTKPSSSKTDDNNEPDVVLVEQKVETIDLRVDSDTENDSEQTREAGSKDDTDIDLKSKTSVTIKKEIEEEINVDIEDENETESLQDINDTHEAEEDLDEERTEEKVEALKHDEVVHTQENTNEDAKVIHDTKQAVIPIKEENQSLKKEKDDIEATNVANKSHGIVRGGNDILNVDDDIIAVDSDDDNVDQVIDNKAIQNTGFCSNKTNDGVVKVEDVKVFSKSDEGQEEANDVVDLDEKIKERNQSSVEQEEIVLPQILNVFGNVTLKAEELVPLANTSNIPEVVLEPDPNPDIDEIIRLRAVEFAKSMDAMKGLKKMEVDVNETPPAVPVLIKNDDEIHVKSEVSDGINSFNISTDLTFDDDGIELVDDGIAFYEDDDEAHNKNVEIKSEKKDEEPNIDNLSFDLKLLMHPVVYSVKLDDMAVFKNKDIYSVRDKTVIDNALIESKPKLRKIRKKENSTIVENTLQIKTETKSSSSDSEDEDCIPDSDKVKLSSNLFKKPRTRNYNPIQLCKNPDFNTRLKRLTVGFLSSTRNRSLLRSLKPMTIDVSKAFESKLINGTIYLKSGESPVKVKHEPSTENESEQTSAVLPLAMPVQSLINNTSVNIPEILQPAPVQTAPKQLVHDNNKQVILNERQKTINLPDINNIRRINQHLLTAEVTPMIVGGNIDKYKPPVQIVAASGEEPLDRKGIVAENSTKKKISDMVCQDILERNKVIDTVAASPSKEKTLTGIDDQAKKELTSLTGKSTLQQKNKKSMPEKAAWSKYSRKNVIKEVLPWNKRPNVSEESLLTLDTLEKMLNICAEGETHTTTSKKKKASKKARDLVRTFEEYSKRLNEGNEDIVQVDNQDTSKDAATEKVTEVVAAVGTECNPPIPKAKCKVVPAKPYADFCCWARVKLHYITNYMRNFNIKHQCPRICACCCRAELASRTKWSSGKRSKSVQVDIKISDEDEIRNITDAIEKVVEESRDSSKSVNQCDIVNSSENGCEIAIQCDLPKPTQRVLTDVEVREIASASNNIIPIVPRAPGPSTPHVRVFNNRRISQRIQNFMPTISLDDDEPRIPTGRYQQTMPASSKAQGHYTTPQGHIIIDGTKKLTVHNKPSESFNVTRRNVKERIVHLNRNGKEELSPIFLGKNQILLTDIKFPSENPTPQVVQHVEHQPKPAETTLALPEGVQLVLLPNGTVSYTVADGVELTDEQKSHIPVIIEAVQKQLGPSGIIPMSLNTTDVPLNSAVAANESNNDVAITGSADVVKTLEGIHGVSTKATNETSKSSDIAMDTIAPTEKTIETASPGEINITNPIETSAMDNINNGSKNQTDCKMDGISMENTITKNDNLCRSNENLPLPNNTADSGTSVIHENREVLSDAALHKTKDNKNTEIEGNTMEVSKDAVVLENAQENVTGCQEKTSDSTEAPVDSRKEDATESSNDAASTNRKSLLSDLMQMSGIWEDLDDTASNPTENTGIPTGQPSETIPAVTVPPPALIPTWPQGTAASASVVTSEIPPMLKPISKEPSLDPSLPELTPISTFAQLKYAIEKGGKFFKLNLDTGILSCGIKVCIKKQLPKSVIDLTEDDDDNEEVQIIETPKTASYNEPIPYKLKKGGQSLLLQNNKCDDAVKPLQLFRSIRILNRNKQPTIFLSSVEEHPRQSEKKKRKRKQDIGVVRDGVKSPKLFSEDDGSRLSSLDSSSLDQYIDKDNESIDTVTSFDSSDDEPLSTKAKRVRLCDTQDDNATFIEVPNAQNEEVAMDVDDQTKPTESPEKKKNLVVAPRENQNDLSENLVQQLPECLMSYMPGDNDEGDEDCILGV